MHPIVKRWGLPLLAACLCAGAALPPARAQSDGEGGAAVIDEATPATARLPRDDAQRLLARPLPDEPEARFALLQQQYNAALQLEQRARVIELARQLVDAGRGRADGEGWITAYLNAEFTWGRSGKALEACEPFIGDAALSPDTRAAVALRQTYFAAQGHDRAVVARLWARADALARQVAEQGGSAAPRRAIDRLQVRSEVERLSANPAASVATLREAVGLARRLLADARARNPQPRAPAVLDAIGWLDGSQGMLVYALVQQGRAPEAVDIAQANLAQWKAGRLSDSLGARWNYRLATSLVALQQHEAGLAAALLSDQMLEQSGASAASHTRWLARQEVVRALMGLQRWKEADESYRAFLAAMPPDLLARTRASDNRLLALLAAKNGRLEEALETADGMARYRQRLYGANHPQTQEAAGVRGVVRLLRGEVTAAMADFDALFAATLDTPGGWLDLDARGMRGFVLGIAFDTFLQHVTAQALKGERVDSRLTDRALQIADHTRTGSTQQALTDSTARVLAATPALRSLLEQEQVLRQAAGAAYARVNTALLESDALARTARSEAFKALPEAERKAHAERQRQARDRVQPAQAEAATARAALDAQRAAVAQQFPAYADLVTPSTPGPEALRRLMQPGEALLMVHPTAHGTLVWLLGADGRNSFAASRLTQNQLADRVAALRGMLDLGAAPAGQRPVLQAEALHALYRELLVPVEGPLRDVKSLIVASSGPLASLPLAALVTEPPVAGAAPAWLVRRMSVTQLPSASALQALRRVARVAPAARPLMGFGDPLFDLARAAAPAPGAAPARTVTRYDAEWGFRYAEVPPLPETRAELQALAQALGADAAADLVLGARATRKAVLSADLGDRRVVAFATHGLMPGEYPGVSKPALAMAADADERESPLLELDDVLGLRLNAQWVLLSACNTAAGEAGGGAMSGLVRGFFFAGARSVLATHWAVETASAAALSVATFKAQAGGGLSRAESLRQAQLALIDGREGGGRWAHPFFWAPYALFGDPVR